MGYKIESTVDDQQETLLQQQTEIKTTSSDEINNRLNASGSSLDSNVSVLPVMEKIKQPSSKDIQNRNLVELISNIYQAGWLTKHVVAILMRPDIETKVKFAERLLKQALSKGYITKHPQHTGGYAAYCATDHGVTFLNQNNIEAERPYRLRVDNGYQVAGDWEHHIFSTASLAHLKNKYKGSSIIYERQLRMMFKDSAKIPDGILKLTHGHAYWLEVERSPKGNDEKKKIHDLIIKANKQKLWLLDGIELYEVLIAYDPLQLDHRGIKVNHHENLTDFFKGNTKDLIECKFASLEVKDLSVESLKEEPYLEFSNEVHERAVLIKNMDWRNNSSAVLIDDSLSILFKYWNAEYSCHDDGTVEWAVDYNNMSLGGRVKDIDTAMKYIAAMLIRYDLNFEPRSNDYSNDDLSTDDFVIEPSGDVYKGFGN